MAKKVNKTMILKNRRVNTRERKGNIWKNQLWNRVIPPMELPIPKVLMVTRVTLPKIMGASHTNKVWLMSLLQQTRNKIIPNSWRQLRRKKRKSTIKIISFAWNWWKKWDSSSALTFNLKSYSIMTPRCKSWWSRSTWPVISNRLKLCILLTSSTKLQLR